MSKAGDRAVQNVSGSVVHLSHIDFFDRIHKIYRIQGMRRVQSTILYKNLSIGKFRAGIRHVPRRNLSKTRPDVFESLTRILEKVSGIFKMPAWYFRKFHLGFRKTVALEFSAAADYIPFL